MNKQGRGFNAQHDGKGGEETLRLKPGLRIEKLGDETMVFDPLGRKLHSVNGDGAEALDLALDDTPTKSVPARLSAAVGELQSAAVMEPTPRWTRRQALAAAGVALGVASVTTFALTDPAAAWTDCPGGGATPPDSGSVGNRYTTPGTHSFKTAAGDTSLFVRLWGAGGGGGGSSTLGTAGSGGGGGGYVDGTVTVSACSTYSLTVGAGGAGGRKNGVPAQSGGKGGDSKFVGTTTLTAPGGNGGGYAGGTPGDGGIGSGGSTNWTGGTGGTGSGSATYQGGGGGGGAGAGSGGGAGGNGSAGFSGTGGGTAGSGGIVEGFSTAGGTGGHRQFNGHGYAGNDPAGGGGGAGVQGSGDGWIGGAGASGQVWVRV